MILPEVKRSHEVEKMDQRDYSFGEYRRCLHDISRLSKLTLQTRFVERVVEQIYDSGSFSTDKPMRVFEVGYGAGDLLFKIQNLRPHIEVSGVDLNPWAKEIVSERYPKIGFANLWAGDFQSLVPLQPIDVVVCSLVAHHLSEVELAQMIDWMTKFARRGWALTDLSRHRMGSLGARVLSAALDVCPMVKNDAAVSMRRAYTLTEVEKIVQSQNDKGWSYEFIAHLPFQFTVSALRKGGS